METLNTLLLHHPRKWLNVLLPLLLPLLLLGCSNRIALPAPVTSPGDAPGYYLVQAGDTLYSISWGLEIDHRTLAAWNGILPPYPLQPGQRLQLYPASPATAARDEVALRPPQPIPSAPPQVEQVSPPPAVASRVARVEPVAPPPPWFSPTPAAEQRAVTPQPALAWRLSSLEPPSPWGEPRWIWPTQGTARAERRGILISGQPGQVVVASERGNVVYSGSGFKGLENLVLIRHQEEYITAYGINRRVLVSEGEQVERGSPIAEMGESRNGAALYFEIRKRTEPLNPLELLPGST